MSIFGGGAIRDPFWDNRGPRYRADRAKEKRDEAKVRLEIAEREYAASLEELHAYETPR